ncbi:hypothetical protein GUJ93_ZPchr0013g33894 [Zizania palustris]|uniref:Uncharacterized protein n=1 Tax=Zizania palustris TaxID=103762 RepID=A0A8J5WX48_ZIZPA|nr:hypothetical protein GUJ93_ZPchr0013g33894 [Zizania palustris]
MGASAAVVSYSASPDSGRRCCEPAVRRSAAARRHCCSAFPSPSSPDVRDGEERGVERRVSDPNSERMTAPGDGGARRRCLKRQSEHDTAATYAAVSVTPPPSLFGRRGVLGATTVVVERRRDVRVLLVHVHLRRRRLSTAPHLGDLITPHVAAHVRAQPNHREEKAKMVARKRTLLQRGTETTATETRPWRTTDGIELTPALEANTKEAPRLRLVTSV